ncbi:MAG: transporter substrate-binding domain-containing protein [Rickettsiaceae bacterium]|nr:transporter substrate-binding domain-containing protein [Rickettsiaceae bacterium]
MPKSKILIRLVFLFLIILGNASISAMANSLDSCAAEPDTINIKAGWIELRPYQYKNRAIYKDELTGLDIEIISNIAKKIGLEINFTEVETSEKFRDSIKTGELDLACGAAFSRKRNEYSFFTEPYRAEEFSLFINESSDFNMHFGSIQEFMAQVRSLNFKIGISEGAIFGDDALDDFLYDISNKDIIEINPNTLTNIKRTINNKIDGFIADRLLVTSLTMETKLGGAFKEIPLGVTTPISFMLSKQTMRPEIIDKINREIKNIKENGEFVKITSSYLFPLLLSQTLSSDWFSYMTIFGVVFFALSGVAIASRENMTLFTAFLLALIPSIPTACIRDYVMNEKLNNIHFMTLYAIIIFIVVIFGYSAVRVLDIFNKDARNHVIMRIFWSKFFILTDTLGRSAFIITGVIFAITEKFEPLEIWGPLCAFFVADGGIIVRDLLVKNQDAKFLNGSINPELSIFWGFVFSIFIKINAENPSLPLTSLGVVIVVFGLIFSRYLILRFKIENLKL